MTVTELSPRQKLVMQYLVNGVSFKEIAVLSGMRCATAKKYAARVKEKTGAKSLYQCIALLVARGVIVPADDEKDDKSLISQ